MRYGSAKHVSICVVVFLTIPVRVLRYYGSMLLKPVVCVCTIATSLAIERIEQLVSRLSILCYFDFLIRQP